MSPAITRRRAGRDRRRLRRGIVVQVAQAARIDLTLEVGSVSETVEINGQAPLLESSSSALGQVIDNRSITNMPLNARNPYALVFTAPGVIGNVAPRFNQANISINGGRTGAHQPHTYRLPPWRP